MGGTDSRGVALGVLLGYRLLRDDDLRAVLQLLKAAGCQLVAGVDAFYRSLSGIGDAGVDVRHLRNAIRDDINKGCLSVVLDSRGRNQDHAMLRGDEQAGIHELVGKQAAVAVVKQCTKFESAGCGINLIVQSEQLARSDFLGLLSVVSIHRKLGSMMDLVEHAGQVILGQRENNCDGLDLGDTSPACAAGGLHEIAGIDQTQANSARERRNDMAVGKLYLVEIKGTLIRPDQPFVLGY